MKVDRPGFYVKASLECIGQAKLLFDDGDSDAFFHDAAGVSGKCMLHAFPLLNDHDFDEKHDLLKLSQTSGMVELDPDLLKREGFSVEKIKDFFASGKRPG